ncbi:RNA polymerase-binding protein Rnk [Leptolinea sp. HRD-7]|nr:RNA polymerase-binding protein Rnk [Leptolinea sp. HRD-7]
MEPRTIRITEIDEGKLRAALREAQKGDYRNSAYIQQLEGELDRAEIVKPAQIPADVITMNSRVVLVDLTEGDRMELTLVFPEDAGKSPGIVSILAPIGTAMIGYREGDVFEWSTPDGPVNLRVEKVVYQPEADGVFD